METSWDNVGEIDRISFLAEVVGGQQKILAAGGVSSGALTLARYNLDGSLDASFGTGGRVTTQGFKGGTIHYGCDMTVQPDGTKLDQI